MMNQYSHPQTYPNQTTHFHLISSAPNSNNSLNENSIYSSYQTSFYNPSITDQSYEYYSNVNEPIYHPIPSSSSFDQCQNYPTQQIYSEYHPTTTTKQSEQFNHEHKIDLNEGQYKWMQIRRAPSKTSGIIRRSIVYFNMISLCLYSKVNCHNHQQRVRIILVENVIQTNN